MNTQLNKQFQQADRLSEANQSQLADLIQDFMTSVDDGQNFEADLRNPKYREYVIEGVKAGEADIQAGRVTPLKDAVRSLKEKFKREHGL